MFISYFPQKYATRTYSHRETHASDFGWFSTVLYLYLKYFAPWFTCYLLVQMHGASLYSTHTHSAACLLASWCSVHSVWVFHSITNSSDEIHRGDGMKSASRMPSFLFAGRQCRPYGLTNIIYSKMNKLLPLHDFMNFQAFGHHHHQHLFLNFMKWLRCEIMQQTNTHGQNGDRLWLYAIWWVVEGSASHTLHA